MGWIGVGLMGHGAAKNILVKGGHPLTILGHRNREPVDDLVGKGAVEVAGRPRSRPERDRVPLRALLGRGGGPGRRPDGLGKALAPGAVLVDATTADPRVTRRIGEELTARGVDMLDAPSAARRRRPKPAAEHVCRRRRGGSSGCARSSRAYADTIIHCGPLGAGTTVKLSTTPSPSAPAPHSPNVFDRGQARRRSRQARPGIVGRRGGRADVAGDGAVGPDGDDSHLKGPFASPKRTCAPTVAWPSPSAAPFPSCKPSIGPSDLPSIAATRRYFCPQRCPAFLQA